jgi:hypothetical protein
MVDEKKKEPRLPIEPVPESEPHKKRTKEEEFFIQEEKRHLDKMREKIKHPDKGEKK